MTDDDRPAFSAHLLVVAEIFARQLSPILVDAYWLALKPYRLDDVLAAMREAMTARRFFPVPAQLLEHVEDQISQRNAADTEARLRRRALPMSDEERAQVDAVAQAALADVHAMLAKLSQTMSWRSRMPVESPLTMRPDPADERAHQEKKWRALARLRVHTTPAAGGTPAPDRVVGLETNGPARRRPQRRRRNREREG